MEKIKLGVDIYTKKKGMNWRICQYDVEITEQDIQEIAMSKYKERNVIDPEKEYSCEIKSLNTY